MTNEDIRARVTCTIFTSTTEDDDHWTIAGDQVDLPWTPDFAAWTGVVQRPPAPEGQRVRLLVTEHDRVPSLAVRAERIVFVGTIDL